MDDVLNEQFERVEKALTTLVDSIAAYNPSTQTAIDLVAADAELSEGLDQPKHQQNHLRIQNLRAEADSLQEQLRTSVKKLAELRHELFETPATTFPEDLRPVPFDELLQYATNIARYTVPPTYRERLPLADKDRQEGDAGPSSAPANGVNTPAVVPQTTEPAKDGTEGDKDGEIAHGVPEITAEEQEWLQKLKASNIAWYPWPSTDKIRSGILYSLQYWQEKGKDLGEFNIPAHLEEQRLRLLHGNQVPEEEAPSQAAQEHIQWGAPRPSKPTGVFMGLDDMD
ncbi:mediator of RNA polymerase II transcription subunit 4 [Decorospora gaudefroyi]|uniref:Mediator of RNA polymerase II transcription subunit 4 n=1 Tax=Decorospora gaudefroyi TaxID=184978 RepID=A0A6A5KDG5_9PLEO|nr:mediator of RNA polymerase II transcription subunit 4 [Decorospora gaudefroyi]